MGKKNKDHKDHKKPRTSENYIPGTEIEVEQFNIILMVPKDAVALEVTATFLDEDGELYRAKKKLSASAIHDARQAFLDNVEGGDDYDAQFVLAPEGMSLTSDTGAVADR